MQFLKYSLLVLVIAILVQQDPAKPPSKFVKQTNPIANRYIVVLKDDVVSDKDSLEVRRAKVTAIAKRHAQTYGGKYDYIYETALRGYAIELPNEAAAIAISKLPEVRWVEQDAALSPLATAPSPGPQKASESVCRGKPVAATQLERPFGLKLHGRRTSFLQFGISQPTRLVIRERDKFNELWNQIMREVSNKPPLPEIDFSREMILVAATGHQPSIYDVIIETACEVDNQLEVVVHTTKFLPCGAYAGMLPQPVEMVRLPKTDLPVVFKETQVTADCKGIVISP